MFLVENRMKNLINRPTKILLPFQSIHIHFTIKLSIVYIEIIFQRVFLMEKSVKNRIKMLNALTKIFLRSRRHFSRLC